MLLENRYSVYSELLSFLNIQEPIQGACFDESILNSSGDFHEFRLNVTEIWPSLKPESVIYKFKNRDRILRTLRKILGRTYFLKKFKISQIFLVL